MFVKQGNAMKKPLLLSLAVATLITTNLSAENMYDRIQAMEAQMKSLKKEISVLQEASAKNEDASVDDEEEDTQELESEDGVIPIEEVLAQDEDAEDAEDAEEEDDGEDEDEFEDETSIADLEESISDLNRATGGNHLKFKVDYRFAVDNLQYQMADGSTAKNDAFMTNRLWINMGYKATNNLTFKGQIAYSKAFGQRSDTNSDSSTNPGYNFENFDWVASENPYDDLLRVRQAYFLWQDRTFLGAQIPWTFSIGRRPSTNGHLINFRDDDHASSPLAHTINVEFDGLSSRFTFIPEWGTSIKLCMGRGMSNAAHKFTSTPYADDTSANASIDLAGLIFVPYDDGQYSIATQYYYANNLIDQTFNAAGVPQESFYTVGGLHSFTANATINGIGEEISDFLDETIFFLSGAFTQTDPNKDAYMLYNQASGEAAGLSKDGYSVWVGTQFPSLISEDGRWGVEYNHGSQYFRSITYAEDTNIGSKIATRGDAYEAYFTEYLVEDILSLQLRYTYINYEYTGSNGFFGGTTGNSILIEDANSAGMGANYVDIAQDIRLYIRYKY